MYFFMCFLWWLMLLKKFWIVIDFEDVVVYNDFKEDVFCYVLWGDFLIGFVQEVFFFIRRWKFEKEIVVIKLVLKGYDNKFRICCVR